MKTLTKIEAINILKDYQRVVDIHKKQAKITRNLLEQIKHISDRIGDKKYIKDNWGDTFDKVYLFLEQSEIKSKLQPKLPLIIEVKSKEVTRPINDKTVKNIFSTYQKFIVSYNEETEITPENYRRLRHIIDTIMPRQSIIKEQYGALFDQMYDFIESLNVQSEIQIQIIDNNTKQKTTNKLRRSKQNKAKKKKKSKTRGKDVSISKEKTERDLICESIKNKAIKIREQRDFDVFNPEAKVPYMPPYNFGYSKRSAFDSDILNEKIAEGKGYSGSK